MNQNELNKSRALAVQHMAALADVARESFLILDADLRVILGNETFYKNFQVSPKETENRFIYELGNGQWNIPEFRNLLERILPEKKDVREYEVKHTFEVIGEKTIVLNAKRIDSEQLIILAMEDITVRKTLEEKLLRTAKQELSRSEENFRQIFESGRYGIILTGADFRFIKVNPAFCQMTGYTEEELLTKGFPDITHPDDLAGNIEAKSKLFRGEMSSYHTEKRYIKKNGETLWVNLHVSVVRNNDGSFGYFLGMIDDISERKRVEIEREQFFKFFQISTDIMVIADPNGCFKKVNPTCLNLLGYAETELLAKPFIDFVCPEDKQSTLDEMKRQIASGSSLNFENRYKCKNGGLVWLSWRATYDKGEGITYATARDITEQKKAEVAEATYVKELKDMNELMVNRELKMIELKSEIEKLKRNAQH